MRVQIERSTRSARRRPATGQESAFTPAFLSAHGTRTREDREACASPTPDARDLRTRALFAGPWEVEAVEPDDRSEGTLHAVVRRAEPMAEGGGAVAVLRSRTTGLLAPLHTLRTLAATPEALSLLVEALDPEILPILGRALMRRVR
jgi:hypothetical protein